MLAGDFYGASFIVIDSATLTKPSSGPGSKPRVNVAERRLAYLQVASRVFLERGLGSASMQDVADAAGVPKVLIYRIFPSKQKLLDAICDHVIQGLHEAYARPNFVYGARARDMVVVARRSPEPFLLVYRYSQAGVEQAAWREAVTSTIAGYTRQRWFAPGPDAPPGAEARAEIASRQNVGALIEVMTRWIDGGDGLSDRERVKWWSRIQREHHLASRDAFRLGTVDLPYRLPTDEDLAAID